LLFKKKGTPSFVLLTGFGKFIDFFHLLPFGFDSWWGATESFILVFSLLDALMRAKRLLCQLFNGSPSYNIAGHSRFMHCIPFKISLFFNSQKKPYVSKALRFLFHGRAG